MSSEIRYNRLVPHRSRRWARAEVGNRRPVLSPMNLRARALETRIEKLKQQITALGDLRPGSLTPQYNVCGKPACRCKATPPLKHGPYYQLSFTWKGNSQTQFVRRQDLPAVRKQLRNYRRLRQLLDRWMVLAMELSRLRLQPEAQRGRKTRPKPRVFPKT